MSNDECWRLFIMDLFAVFKLLGGLGLFLYGMSVMGGSLERFAGGKLESILEKFTNNPLKGVLLGAIVTAIIQSSSATTVMTVGFVNSGIMRLSQAIGIIMGSNVGTTITSWILSLAGVESSNFFVMILQPKNFCLILAAIGSIFAVFIKSERKKIIGHILLGFTILIYGMDFMSSAVSPLRSNPDFQNLLIMFKNPIAGVLLGAIVTAIVQSSSASVGILQALSVTGAITYSSAIPIILGQNIGTCVTAMISSISAKREAKRAAFVHLYFNVIGTVIFLILVYSVQTVIKFTFWNNSVNAFDIALIHTIFNVFCTVIFLPFTSFLAKLAIMTVKDQDDSTDIITGVSLDSRFLNSSGFAIEQCKNTIRTLCNMTSENCLLAIDSINDFSQEKLNQVAENETNIDIAGDKANEYIIEITKLQLTAKESRYITKLLHSINGIARIADTAKNIVNSSSRISASQVVFSDDAQKELDALMAATKELLQSTMNACAEDDVDKALNIYPLSEVVYLMCSMFRIEHIERIKTGACTTQSGIYFDELILHSEHIADQCANIAVQVIGLENENYRKQEFLENLRKQGDNDFNKKYQSFKQEYLLKASLTGAY